MSDIRTDPATISEGALVAGTPPEDAPHSPQTTETSQTDDRNLDVIRKEILNHKQQVELSFIEMGKLLIEAKDKVKHGQWLPWLRDNIDISAVTAGRLMRIAREFSNSSPVTNLGFAKVSILLALPSEEREAFIAQQHKVDDTLKCAERMSKRELQKVVHNRLRALKSSPETKTDKEFIMNPVIKDQQGAERYKSSIQILENLDTLQHRVDVLLAENSDSPRYKEAVDKLHTFCKETLDKIPI